MATNIIITISILLLIAYLFESTSSKTRIPSIILLLFLGFILNIFTQMLKINIPNIQILLPILGTIGLILIVLEGALELELNKQKYNLLISSFIIALLAVLIKSIILAIIFKITFNVSSISALINAVPFCVISSAVAITSSKNLIEEKRDFITYESSFSDIFGILFFNFFISNDKIDYRSILLFLTDIVIIIAISFVAVIFLTYLLSKIQTDVKYTPIILLLILIYSSAKYYHLPSLVFILLFGLFLRNFYKITYFKITEMLNFDVLSEEVNKFREIVIEATFIIKALFFLTFGFFIKIEEVINLHSLVWTVIILTLIYCIRFLLLKLFKKTIKPILFIAPRGLITVLLFISIPSNVRLPIINNSLIIQVVILTSLIMMIGLINYKSETKILNFFTDKLYRYRNKEK